MLVVACAALVVASVSRLPVELVCLIFFLLIAAVIIAAIMSAAVGIAWCISFLSVAWFGPGRLRSVRKTAPYPL